MKKLAISLIGASLLGLSVIATPAMAQSAPSDVAPETVPAGAPDPAAQIAALREELVSAQQEIVTLRAQVANQKDLEAALETARAKNGRLVAIGNELIAAYAKRYQRGQFLPFDNGRRKFEAELQDMGDSVYDNRWDANPRRATAPATPQAAPSNSAQQSKQNDQ